MMTLKGNRILSGNTKCAGLGGYRVLEGGAVPPSSRIPGAAGALVFIFLYLYNIYTVFNIYLTISLDYGINFLNWTCSETEVSEQLYCIKVNTRATEYAGGCVLRKVKE
ncbi:MAG: hypothetical protein LBF75_11060 [Treponema sp.]|jgi:hypothetical protein|nr:hypothetical protein [Treponema sp.]